MKKIKFTPLLLSMFFLLTGCDSEEQKAENEKNLRQAEKNAVAYIEQKYGFTPEIIESELERHGGMFGSTPDTSAVVRMSCNGKDFSVYIDGSTQNTDGADNFQQDEIISALMRQINDIAPQVKSIHIDGGEAQGFYPRVEWDIENMYSEYFDGENFAEVFADNICDITADYINSDFISLDESFFDFLLKNKWVRLYMISYRSEKDYQEKPDYNSFSDFNAGITKYAIQIEETLAFEKGEAEHNEYVLGKHDNFYYYVNDNTPDTVSFTPGHMPDASEFDGNGIIGGEFVTPAYNINSTVNKTIYIYYPISELPEKSRLATCRKTDDGNKIHISPLTYDIGDYRMVYTDTDGSEVCFAFITEKENIYNEQ